ncbi:MAG TPA: ribosome maturation factor [Puia sp.]|jgi:ribosome maturation factor RimP|nr:ribosome maturation factor [Puia sp.]
MGNDTQNQVIESFVQAILAEEPSYFLVELKMGVSNNIKLFLDGDGGITIDKCVKVNRALYKKIEEAGLFRDGDFSLEVSSPGLEEPLKLIRQYRKNIGRLVEIQLLDGLKLEGRLMEVSEDGIIVEETKGKKKKKEMIRHSLLFNNIKTTKIQIVF